MTIPVNDRYEDVQGVSLLAIDQYFRDVAWIQQNPLTQEEEMRHVARLLRARSEPSNAWVQSVAKYSREVLVEAYQPVLLSVARKIMGQFRGSSALNTVELLDLVNEANVGLLHVLDTYEFDDVTASLCGLVARTSSYYIFKALRRLGGSVHVPNNMLTMIAKVVRVRSDLSGRLGRAPSLHEIALEMGVEVSVVIEVSEAHVLRSMDSLQGVLVENDDEDNRLVSGLFSSVSSDEAQRQDALNAVLLRTVEKLPELQRDVVCLRFGLEAGQECLLHREIALRLGVLKEVVGRSERRACARLQNMLDLSVKNGHVSCTLCSTFEDDYYTGAQVAALLKVKRPLVLRHTKNGHLPGKQRRIKNRAVWVYPKPAIDALVAERQEMSA